MADKQWKPFPEDIQRSQAPLTQSPLAQQSDAIPSSRETCRLPKGPGNQNSSHSSSSHIPGLQGLNDINTLNLNNLGSGRDEDLRGIVVGALVPNQTPVSPIPFADNVEGVPQTLGPPSGYRVRCNSLLRDNTPEYMSQLRSFIQPREVLQENGFIVEQLSPSSLNRKKKCRRCGKACKSMTLSGSVPKLETQRISSCKFHIGVWLPKNCLWSCCGKAFSADPCKTEEHHIEREYPEGFFEELWKFHHTPNLTITSTTRAAVAIDCEMGTAISGDPELIRVTVVDYFSSHVLVDSLVFPDVEMQHYNTRYSGVTPWEMERANRDGKCLMGKKKAREAVWMYVGPETVVVGHGVNNDLCAMRWIHTAIVDTMLNEILPIRVAARAAKKQAVEKAATKDKAESGMEGKDKVKAKLEEKAATATVTAVMNSPRSKSNKPKGTGPYTLKTMTKMRLGRDIQTNRSKGHDSHEDAVAARDLAHWLVMNKVTREMNN